MIHLIEGPVGAGKSTFAAQLSLTQAAPRLNLDDWMATLFRPDRPDSRNAPDSPDSDVMQWYLERKQRCIEQIWQLTSDLIDTGTSVILELGLIQRQARADFYSRVDASGYELRIYVLDAPKEIRRQRVRERNAARSGTYRMQVPDAFFELASSQWQEPDDVECSARDIEFVTNLERPMGDD
jgi:predicted kinase